MNPIPSIPCSWMMREGRLWTQYVSRMICGFMPRKRFTMIRGAIAIRGIRLLGGGMICVTAPLLASFLSLNIHQLLHILLALTKPGIPEIFSRSKTLATEVVNSDDKETVFKLRQEYTPKLIPKGKAVNSLLRVALDGQGKVVYHKDMWNEKDYSHEGLGKAFKTLNGDHLAKIMKPPKSLQ